MKRILKNLKLYQKIIVKSTHKNTGILYQSSSYGNALFLTSRHSYTSLPNNCVITIGKFLYKVVTIGGFGSLVNFDVRSIWSSVSNVFFDTGIEQGRLLIDVADTLSSKPFWVEALNVEFVNCY